MSSTRFNVILRTVGVAACLAVLAATGCPCVPPPTDDGGTPQPGRMVTGPAHEELRQQVGPAGGTVRVDDAESPIDGFELVVPAGAFAAETDIVVSWREIVSHDFGEDFDPILPLIDVEHGAQAADVPMLLTLPMAVDDEDFAMAFAYDEEEESFEGLTIAHDTPGQPKMMVRHFSPVTASKIPKARLHDAFETSFHHGVDNWRFVNRGSFVAPRGHCAGQSVSAMAYHRIFREAGAPGLYTRFDNNEEPGHPTPDFQWDDTRGYRLASVVQAQLRWDDDDRALANLAQLDVGPLTTYYAFTYAMRLTGRPQYVSIRNAEGGHAMIVYSREARRTFDELDFPELVDLEFEGARFFVSDPNYPEPLQNTRGLVFNLDDRSMRPYMSGANADETGRAYPYAYFTRVKDLAEDVDWGALWEQVDQGRIGEGYFPAFRLVLYPYDPDTQSVGEAVGELGDDLELSDDTDALLARFEDRDPEFPPALHAFGEAGGELLVVAASIPSGFLIDVSSLSEGDRLGLRVDGQVTSGTTTKDRFIDFGWSTVQRTVVEVGDPTITGTEEVGSPVADLDRSGTGVAYLTADLALGLLDDSLGPVGALAVPGHSLGRGLDVLSGFALVAAGSFHLVNLAVPATPSVALTEGVNADLGAVADLGGYALAVGKRSYEDTGVLFVIDLADPSNPSLTRAVGELELGDRLVGVAVVGDGSHAVITGNHGEIYIVDVSVRGSPTLVKTFPSSEVSPQGGGGPVVIQGNLAFTVRPDLRVLDVGDPAQASLLNAGRYDVYEDSPRDLAVRGDLAYLVGSAGSANEGYLAVFDVSDASAPSYTGRRLTLPGVGLSIALGSVEGRAFVGTSTTTGGAVLQVQLDGSP